MSIGGCVDEPVLPFFAGGPFVGTEAPLRDPATGAAVVGWGARDFLPLAGGEEVDFFIRQRGTGGLGTVNNRAGVGEICLIKMACQSSEQRARKGGAGWITTAEKISAGSAPTPGRKEWQERGTRSHSPREERVRVLCGACVGKKAHEVSVRGVVRESVEQ